MLIVIETLVEDIKKNKETTKQIAQFFQDLNNNFLKIEKLKGDQNKEMRRGNNLLEKSMQSRFK